MRDTQATEPLDGELSEPLQQRIRLVMEFFLALASRSTRQRQEEPETKAARRCQWCLKPAHRKLAKGYLEDSRFVAYYDDACGKGATEFLCQIIQTNVS